jgi:hypothetical protein
VATLIAVKQSESTVSFLVEGKTKLIHSRWTSPMVDPKTCFLRKTT